MSIETRMFRSSSAERGVPGGRVAGAAGAMALLLLLLAVVSAAAESGDGPRRFDLAVSGGRVAGEALGGGETLRVRQGEQIVLRWLTDKAVELHLHGYDIELSVAPGTPAEMAFRADLTGRFPVTRHGGDGHDESLLGHGHATLLYLEVHPR